MIRINALTWISLLIFLTGADSFSAVKICRSGLHPAPAPIQGPLTIPEQILRATELKELFLKQPITQILVNPRKESRDSYVASFAGTNIRAILKKVAIHEIVEGVDVGLRGAMAEEETFELSNRLGCNCFPFVVKRYISEKDPLRKAFPELTAGTYVLSYMIENAERLSVAKGLAMTKSDPVYRQVRHADASFVRLEILDAVAGNSDGFEIMYDPQTKKWFVVDGSACFSRSGESDLKLYGSIPLNYHHYLNDREFFDQLAALNAEEVFRGLQKMNVPAGKFELNYKAAQRQLELVQHAIRALPKK